MEEMRMKIIGISMRKGMMARVLVEGNEATKEAIVRKYNDITKESVSNMKELCNRGYGSGNYYEIEVVIEDNSYTPIYFFDDYHKIDVTITNEEQMELEKFVRKWIHKLPDNNDLLLGDCEWADRISNKIPWKYQLAV